MKGRPNTNTAETKSCVVGLDNGKFKVPVPRKSSFTATDKEIFFNSGVSSIEFDFEDIPKSNVEINDSLYISGAILKSFDGNEVVEQGFLLAPTDLSNAFVASAGTGDDTGVGEGMRFYYARYTWLDAKDVLHVSDLSPQDEVDVGPADADKDVVVSIPTLNITDKTNVQIELFGTGISNDGVSASTVFFKIGSIANDRSKALVDITHKATSITDDIEILDTNITPITVPGSEQILTANNRIFARSSEFRNRVYFSEILLPGRTALFLGDFFEIDRGRGDVTAIAPLLINKANAQEFVILAFTRDDIFFVTGAEASTRVTISLITSDAGCIDSKSIAVTSKGCIL